MGSKFKVQDSRSIINFVYTLSFQDEGTFSLTETGRTALQALGSKLSRKSELLYY